MTDPADDRDEDRRARLEALEAKLAARRAADAPRPHQGEHYSQANLAWRMVIEMVAGLGIGFGIGYGLDALIGTKPFLMIVFTLLGFVAGVKTMIRSAREFEVQQAGADTPDDSEGR